MAPMSVPSHVDSPLSRTPTLSGTDTPPTGINTPAAGTSGISTPNGLKKVRILMLHGFTQSGRIFHGKTNSLEKKLTKAFLPLGIEPVLIYPTAPNRLAVDDVVGWERRQPPIQDYEPDTWAWYRSDEAQGTYRLLEEGMDRLAETLRQARELARAQGDEGGGVDGVLGFSQGGCMAGMLASALDQVHEPRAPAEKAHAGWLQRIREANGGLPLKFAVIYGGFKAAPADLAWLYDPEIGTPTMHWMGALDTVVSEERSMGLVKRCIDPAIVNFPGGHFVPVDNKYVEALVSFIYKFARQGKGEQMEGKGTQMKNSDEGTSNDSEELDQFGAVFDRP